MKQQQTSAKTQFCEPTRVLQVELAEEHWIAEFDISKAKGPLL